MKKTLAKGLILVSTLLLFACSNVSCKSPRMVALEQDIISGLKEEYPDENFYFIYGIDKEGSIATNVRYRGILYSDRLAEMSYPGGLEIGFESANIGYSKIYAWSRAYGNLFKHIEFESLGEEKAKELFGEKTIFQINWTLTDEKYEGMKKILGKRGLSREEKYGSWNTIVNVFVGDLEKLDIERYKENTRALAEYLYDYLNYVTYLQVYVWDDSYFENHDLVKASVYRPFREKEDIRNILSKIENGEKVEENEKLMLVNNFYKGIGFYEVSEYRKLIIITKDIKEKDDIKNEFLGVTSIRNLKEGEE